MDIITVQDLCKTFTYSTKEKGLKGSLRNLFNRQIQTKTAVNGVSFTVEKGEAVGLLGPNGAGKTTTLKMLSGILYPTSGSAAVAGYTPWERRRGYQRRFAIVMGQKSQLWPDLPALDTFELNRRIYEIDEDAYRRTLDELTSLLDVRALLQVQVRRLSLGERMKMELIAALLHRPDILYPDEPTIGLDILSQRSIRDFLKYYNEQTRTTLLLTSHYTADIEALCLAGLFLTYCLFLILELLSFWFVAGNGMQALSSAVFDFNNTPMNLYPPLGTAAGRLCAASVCHHQLPDPVRRREAAARADRLGAGRSGAGVRGAAPCLAARAAPLHKRRRLSARNALPAARRMWYDEGVSHDLRRARDAQDRDPGAGGRPGGGHPVRLAAAVGPLAGPVGGAAQLCPFGAGAAVCFVPCHQSGRDRLQHAVAARDFELPAAGRVFVPAVRRQTHDPQTAQAAGQGRGGLSARAARGPARRAAAAGADLRLSGGHHRARRCSPTRSPASTRWGTISTP